MVFVPLWFLIGLWINLKPRHSKTDLPILIDLLDFSVFNIFSVMLWRPFHLHMNVLPGRLHYIINKQLAAFPDIRLAHWFKKSEVCWIDVCQTSKRMLSELGFNLATSRLTASIATDSAMRARDIYIINWNNDQLQIYIDDFSHMSSRTLVWLGE